MIAELRLVNFDSQDHVDIALLVALRNKVFNRSKILDVDVGINASFNVHNQIAKDVGFDDFGSELAIHVDDVEAIVSIGPESVLDPCLIILVCQDLISVTWVLSRPGACCVEISLLEIERIHLPCLPDFSRKRCAP